MTRSTWIFFLMFFHWFPEVNGYREVCYQYGCYSNAPPYDNAKGYLPQSPAYLATKHNIFSRHNRMSPVTIDLRDMNDASIKIGLIDAFRPLKILIHGFTSSCRANWLHQLKNELLDHEDVNVYIVCWKKGAEFPNYYQAVANLRVVAAEVKFLLDILVEEGLNLDKVHIIGHSLGAHMAGEVGKLTRGKIGRITGLDPAAPAFEELVPFGTSEQGRNTNLMGVNGISFEVRLDQSDAMFVDVIHCDGENGDFDDGLVDALFNGGFGMFFPSGHIDFYVNGGQDQPGCNDGIFGLFSRKTGKQKRKMLNLLGNIGSGVGCSHSRAVALMIDSVKSPCGFKAYPCDSYAKFKTGSCLNCNSGECNVMGYHCNPQGALGNMYLNTFDKAPFCGYHYGVHLKPITTGKGQLTVAVKGKQGSTKLTPITTRRMKIKGKTSVQNVVLGKSDVGNVTSLVVIYDRYWFWDPYSIKVKHAHVTSGVTGQRWSECYKITRLRDEVEQVITDFKIGSC